MVWCGISLASLLAVGLFGNLALRGRVAGVAIAAIVISRPITILIVITTITAQIVRYTCESSKGQSPLTCCCNGSCDLRSH
jgi:hypothetical protein